MMSSEQARERSVNAKKPSLRMAGVENTKQTGLATEDRRQQATPKPGLGHLGAPGKYPANFLAAQNRQQGSEGSPGTSLPDRNLKPSQPNPDLADRPHHHHDFRIVQQAGFGLNERKTADQLTSSINRPQFPQNKLEERLAVEGPFSALPKKGTGKVVGPRPRTPS